MTGNDSRGVRARQLADRLILLAGGVCLGLLLAEVVLVVAGQPRIYQTRSSPFSFLFSTEPVKGRPFYVNTPGGIRFTYDGNPRGYFGPRNEVDHQTNSRGFRGEEFQKGKPADTVRLVFLGDSFTFGEGVNDSDTYPEVTRALLLADMADSSLKVESVNLGVGGYNTGDSLRMLQFVGLGYAPDVVVLGYVLNDAEPPLFEHDPVTGDIVWTDSARDAPEAAANRLPPDSWFYRLSTVRLIWQYFTNRESLRRTIEFYTSLYEESATAWHQNRRALHDIIALCQSRQIPCIVLLFPILHQLNDDYPFAEIHAEVGDEVQKAGGMLIDLFPRLKGRNGRDLWVHPTDQHPNEAVHAIAAEELAAAIESLQVIQRADAERRVRSRNRTRHPGRQVARRAGLPPVLRNGRDRVDMGSEHPRIGSGAPKRAVFPANLGISGTDPPNRERGRAGPQREAASPLKSPLSLTEIARSPRETPPSRSALCTPCAVPPARRKPTADFAPF